VDVSIVIPAYNEERRIGPTLAAVHAHFAARGRPFEIVVVDDGSRDGTSAAVTSFAAGRPEVSLVRHAANRGKGGAVRTGVLAARGDTVLVTDADLSTPIAEYDRLRAVLDGGTDVVIASRGLPGSRIVVPQPWYRRRIGRVFPLLVRLLVTRAFVDTQCGFKLYRRAAAAALFEPLRHEGFAFDVEVLVRALKRGMRVREEAVEWRNSPESTVNILRDPWKMLAALFAIRRLRD